MKALELINRSCYGMCLLAVVVGAFMAIWAIWTDQHDVLGKGLATVATLVFSGIVMIILNNTLGERLLGDGGYRGGRGGVGSQPGTPLSPPGSESGGEGRRQALERLTAPRT